MPNIRISHMHTPACGKVTRNRLELACVDDRWFEMKVEPLTEHPDVAGCGEAPEVDGLRGHPLNGKFAFRCYKRDTKQQDYSAFVAYLLRRSMTFSPGVYNVYK